MMPGQPSLPDITETITDDHPEHHHQPQPVNHSHHHHQPITTTTTIINNHNTVVQEDNRKQEGNVHLPHTGVTLPVMTEKPGPISGIPPKSSGAASEEPPMTPVRIEDIAVMPSEELTNPIEPPSNEVVIEEMSEHDEMISTLTIHKFKEVLHEIIKDAVDKIVMKKAGIVEKLITAKQNLIGHSGEVTGTEFQAMDTCLCDQDLLDRRGRGDCNSRSRDFNGRKWCFLETFSFCHDEVASRQFPGRFWSHDACS